MNIDSQIKFMRYLAAAVFVLASFVWLFLAWAWYNNFPVPYVWIVWAATAPLWWFGAAAFAAPPLIAASRTKRLKHKGLRIRTKFLSCDINFMVKYNARYPYTIQSVGPNPKTGEKLIFSSENLWFNPQPFLTPEQNIDVVVDPDDVKCYSMDISFLAERAKEVLK